VSDTAYEVVPLGDGAALAVVSGQLGAFEASDFDAFLEDAVAPPVRRLVIDLTQADVADPDAVSRLYDAARLLRARDGLLAIASPDGSTVRRVLDTSGLSAAFNLYATRRAALDDLGLAEPAA
jgi:anti-anti-sigma regulatory factor